MRFAGQKLPRHRCAASGTLKSNGIPSWTPVLQDICYFSLWGIISILHKLVESAFALETDSWTMKMKNLYTVM